MRRFRLTHCPRWHSVVVAVLTTCDNGGKPLEHLDDCESGALGPDCISRRRAFRPLEGQPYAAVDHAAVEWSPCIDGRSPVGRDRPPQERLEIGLSDAGKILSVHEDSD